MTKLNFKELDKILNQIRHKILDLFVRISRKKDFVKLEYLNFKIEAKNLDGKTLSESFSLKDLDLSEEED